MDAKTDKLLLDAKLLGLPYAIIIDGQLIAAFAIERNCGEIKRYVYDTSVHTGFGLLDWLLDRARRDEKIARLSGEPSPNEDLGRALLRAASDVRNLAQHECRYDADDWCVVCGMDGRA